MTTLQENLFEIKEMIENNQAIAAYEKFYDEDVIVKSPGEPILQGKRKCVDAHAEYFTMASEFSCTVNSLIAGENMSAIETTYSVVVHGGKFTFNAVAVHEWKNGKITYERFYKDNA